MNSKLIAAIASLEEMEFNVRETLMVLKQQPVVVMSWGFSEATNLHNKALVFKVNGHHHTGYVAITLNWSDTYTVHILSTYGHIIKSIEMVYFDMLVDVIDKEVEYVPEYGNQ